MYQPQFHFLLIRFSVFFCTDKPIPDFIDAKLASVCPARIPAKIPIHIGIEFTLLLAIISAECLKTTCASS